MDRDTKRLLLGAAACAVAFGLLVVLAYWWEPARDADGSALRGFVGLERAGAMEDIISLADPLPYAVMSAVLVLVALARRRPGRALVAALLLGGSALTTQALKSLLAFDRHERFLGPNQVEAAAFPSGHATASMALAFAAVLVAPAALRLPLAALGMLFTLAISFSIVALGGHYPSDILGGYLVASTWFLAAFGAVHARRTAAARSGRELELPPRWAAAAVLLAALAITIPFAPDAIDYAERHTAFAVVACAIGAAAAGLLVGVAMVSRPRR